MITKNLVLEEIVKCIHKECAESQLEREMLLLNESKEYVITHGCGGYQKQGCYNCNGYNNKCKTYTIFE
jgi:hypothetical protein